MPKQLVAIAPGTAALMDYEDRPIAVDEVKVQSLYASPKHGSELAAFRGESPHIADYYDERWQMFLSRDQSDDSGVRFGHWNLGNQWVGVISEIGCEVTGFSKGDIVCGYGGIRETHIVKAIDNYYLFRVPEEMSWSHAVCFDPAQFALGAIRDSGMRMGDRVAVFGLGAIGQIAAQLAKLAGASYVAVVDPIERRRDVALRNGADAAFDPVRDDVGLLLKQDTDKLGVDVVIETSANEHALQQALRGLAYGGSIAYAGWARPFKGGLDLGREAHFNNASIVFSRACSEPNRDHPRWSWRRIENTCWNLLKSGALNCDDIIYPVVPFEQVAHAYSEFVDRTPEMSIKLGVMF